MKKDSQDGNTYVYTVTIDEGDLIEEDSPRDDYYIYFLFKDNCSNERVHMYIVSL